MISIIVAMTGACVIGKDNKLPWHLSEDLKRFKRITMGKPIIMGRKTFESIGHPLPGRANIVLSREKKNLGDGVSVVHSFEEALQITSQDEERFFIGGAELFRQALPMTERIYLTLIHQDFPGDTFFPRVDLFELFQMKKEGERQWSETEKFYYSFFKGERDLGRANRDKL